MKPKLWISAGHSGHEVGTVGGDGMTEESITRKVTAACKALGMPVIPFDLNLQQRIAWANKKIPETDYLIEVHEDTTDANPKTDCGIYYLSGNAFSRRMASTIIDLWQQDLGIDETWIRGDQQARQGRLGIVRDTKCPAWLLEMNDIDDVQVRKDTIAKGALVLWHIARVLSGDADPVLPEPVPDEPSEWAADAWKRFVDAGIIQSGDPRGMLTMQAVNVILYRMKGLQTLDAPLTRERFVVALDRMLHAS